MCMAQGLSNSCCGMLFNSRGFKTAADQKGQELESELVRVSQGGKIPIVCDTSPCLAQIKGQLKDSSLKCALWKNIQCMLARWLQRVHVQGGSGMWVG